MAAGAKADTGEAIKERYGKYEYREAKAFLRDATLVRAYEDTCVGHRLWQKPDGSRWAENESKLEAPEDSYLLVKTAPAGKS